MARSIFVLATLVMIAACSDHQSGNETDDQVVDSQASTEDNWLWLEEVEGADALTWVEEQNEVSLGYLESLPTYEPMRERNLSIYDSEDRIASPGMRGDFIYNFWRDANNERGIWRRATLDSYVSGEPEWQTVLDVDALAAEEEEDWVWKGAFCLRPAYERCTLRLSRGGADAVVVREYDVVERDFVEDGFFVEEGKTWTSWVDADTIFIGGDFGEGTTTDSGYPRTYRIWQRGEPLEEATEIFAGEQEDVAVGVYRFYDGDTAWDIANRSMTFYASKQYVYDDGDLHLIDIPEDASFWGVMKGQMLVELKSAWTPEDVEYVQAALLTIDFEQFMAGARDFEVLVEPTETSAIRSILSTRDYVLVNELDNVVSRVSRFEFADGAWGREPVEIDGLGNISLLTSSDDSNVFFFSYEDFLSPDTLYVASDGGRSIEEVQSLPEFFDADDMSVEQYFATSADGTRVPYFVVFPADFELNGDTPTLIYGYGGFEVSLVPSYSATVGHSWLERGGVYVVANIRGGGEYGPSWHQAALLENRQRAYDDMAAIAEDLIARNITSPDRLGVRGGSNGGLLTGVMLTQRPDLFGAVVIQVPLLDMQRYNKLLAGASWMGEYGDPDTDDWEFISQYSPYHNLDEDTDYPTPFVTTSTRDDRVHPGHARKMVARMTEMGHEVLYYENTVGGHAGATNNQQSARVQALIYSYVWDQLGDP